MLSYIIYTVFGLACSFLVYRSLLKQQKTFQFNRFFLLTTLGLCLLAPLMEIELFSALPSLEQVNFQSQNSQTIGEEYLTGTLVESIERQDNSVEKMLLYLYLTVVGILLARYALNLYRIIKLIKEPHEIRQGLKFVYKNQKHASSFFNYLFLDKNHLSDEGYAKSLIMHEKIHFKQLHTLDILFIELLLCVFWFNPFVWFYKKEIRENHEFMVDDQVIKMGIDIEDYSNSMIYSKHHSDTLAFTSAFNFIHIKNRLIMLHQSKSSVLKRTFKIVMALTLFVAIFSFSSFKDSKPPLVVVVDAGHGGHDSGNLIEKEVVLQIANKLSLRSGQKVKIIQTRNMDEFITLADRVDFINQQKPDLLLSLHCNAYRESDENGVEAFYYEDNEHKEKSHAYGKALVENQLNLFASRGQLKTAGFFILKNVDCPAIVLELGFITNEKDKAVLTDDLHQESIAKALYKSLLKIREDNNK